MAIDPRKLIVTCSEYKDDRTPLSRPDRAAPSWSRRYGGDFLWPTAPLQMGNALIAATALEHWLPVFTGNVKHFAVVDGLQIEAFVP